MKETYPDSIILCQDIVPDDISLIRKALTTCIKKECDVIFTTGGTGVSPRDVTPEATRSFIEKETPGISFAMYQEGLTKTPLAMLSRYDLFLLTISILKYIRFILICNLEFRA